MYPFSVFLHVIQPRKHLITVLTLERPNLKVDATNVAMKGSSAGYDQATLRTAGTTGRLRLFLLRETWGELTVYGLLGFSFTGGQVTISTNFVK